MRFYILCGASFAAAAAAQFLLCAKAKTLLPKLIPGGAVLILAFYSLLRILSIIRYPSDGSSFLDTGVLTGIILMVFAAFAAAGCVAGLILHLIIRFIKQRKLKKVNAANSVCIGEK